MASAENQRRAVVLATGLLIALAAYFQASGLSWLLSAELAETAVAKASSAPESSAPRLEAPRGATARAILERNPFDSVTGPLSPEPAPPPTPMRPELEDPLAAPRCAGVRVDSTAESSDPSWSTAVVQVASEPHGHVRRVGHAVAGKTVAYIGYNPRERSPAVWFSGAEGLCQSLLFDNAKAGPAPLPPKPVAKQPARPSGRGPPPVPKQLGDKIRQLGPNELEIDRSAVDVIMSDYSSLMRGVIARPVVERGKVAGLRLLRSTPGSLLDRLGLRNGDIVKTLNGFPLGSPENALKAYARLRTAGEIRVEITRSGKPTTVYLHIR